MPTIAKFARTQTAFEAALREAPHVQVFYQLCEAQGIQPLLVGGAVRDGLLRGVLSDDLDWVVPPERSETLANAAAEALGGKCICLDPDFRIYRVILDGGSQMLDIAGQIGDSREADLYRRDLTVNAIGYDPATGEYLDPTGGLDDLTHGLIRMVSRENLLEDPLRLLRVYRIAADLGFTHIDPLTRQVVIENGARLFRAATERIHYEWMRLLSAPTCASHVRMMVEDGLLVRMFPEFAAMGQVHANRYHHLDLWDHTLELLVQAEAHFPDLPPEIQTHLLAPWNPFIRTIAVVRLACLLHDIAKPATMAVNPDTGHFSYYRHDEVGARVSAGIAHRCKWGRDLTDIVCRLVRWHLYPGNLLAPEVTPKAKRKFFRRVGDMLPELILVAIADRYSAQGPEITPAEVASAKQGLLALWPEFQAFQQSEQLNATQLIRGRDVMTRLGLPPGPEIGAILSQVRDAWLNGEISTEDEAWDWLAKARPSQSP